MPKLRKKNKELGIQLSLISSFRKDKDDKKELNINLFNDNNMFDNVSKEFDNIEVKNIILQDLDNLQLEVIDNNIVSASNKVETSVEELEKAEVYQQNKKIKYVKIVGGAILGGILSGGIGSLFGVGVIAAGLGTGVGALTGTFTGTLAK